MIDVCMVDGELTEGSSASARIDSLGFAYGLGVFETMKLLGGAPCFFDEHFARMRKAALEMGLRYSQTEEALADRIRSFVNASECREGMLKALLWEEGGACRECLAIRSAGIPEARDALRLRESLVVKSAMAFTSKRKTLNYAENWLELRDANAHGFDEALFANESGYVTEACMANVFFVSDGELSTPRVDCGILDGIVRARVLEIAQELGIRSRESAISLSEAFEADEAFLTNSGTGISLVLSLARSDGASEKRYEPRLAFELRKFFAERERESARRWR